MIIIESYLNFSPFLISLNLPANFFTTRNGWKKTELQALTESALADQTSPVRDTKYFF